MSKLNLPGPCQLEQALEEKPPQHPPMALVVLAKMHTFKIYTIKIHLSKLTNPRFPNALWDSDA